MHVEAETTVERPRPEVFDYLARAEHLPEYVTQFAWVRQTSGGAPARGTAYSYKMGRGPAEGTFEWTEFEPHSKLAWHGPPAKAGGGSMEPAGWWELSDEGSGTHVKLVMTPTPGGLFKLMAPFMSRGMRKGNAEALERLKQRLEGGQPVPDTDTQAPDTQAPDRQAPDTQAPDTQAPDTQAPDTHA
jgi:uncharacterized protein YndB with AHSA1/START domain